MRVQKSNFEVEVDDLGRNMLIVSKHRCQSVDQRQKLCEVNDSFHCVCVYTTWVSRYEQS
jgi:hypothetical protein